MCVPLVAFGSPRKTGSSGRVRRPSLLERDSSASGWSLPCIPASFLSFPRLAAAASTPLPPFVWPCVLSMRAPFLGTRAPRSIGSFLVGWWRRLERLVWLFAGPPQKKKIDIYIYIYIHSSSEGAHTTHVWRFDSSRLGAWRLDGGRKMRLHWVVLTRTTLR